MITFLRSLHNGVQEVEPSFKELLDKLIKAKAIKQKNNTFKLDEKYRLGRLDISKNGTGYLETFGDVKYKKDLLIDPKDLNTAGKGDIILAKKIFSKGSRPKAKVVLVLKRESTASLVCLKKEGKKVFAVNIKTLLNTSITASKKSLHLLPDETILKIDNETGMVLEVLGVLSDEKIDEKISLAMFNKVDEFSKESENEAISYGKAVDKSMYPDYEDLVHLPFCTIDPVSAKDFDDAIYFDVKNHILYVAIADVSTYVSSFSFIDKDAKQRGFSIYFPHKSIPMLPRNLSENICSLKPNEDRLAFCFKIHLDKDSLKVKKEELLNVVINSKKRYNYDQIDLFLQGNYTRVDGADKEVFSWLKPLSEITKRLKKQRLSKGYDFRSEEFSLCLDENQSLVSVKKEDQTPSHELIEDCMLLANKAAAKRIDSGIFRNHESPSYERIEELLIDLEMIGIEVNFKADLNALIKDIQTRADEIGLREDVDKLIIKSQKKAMYQSENKGHFGLGFERYTHFTSPIRRYSDLILHRILKAKVDGDEKYLAYQLSDIDNLCEKISFLERESDLVARDFSDRKFARWAAKHIDKEFQAIVTDAEQNPIAKLDDKIKGARIMLIDTDVELLDRVMVKILEVNLLQATIIGKITRRLNV